MKYQMLYVLSASVLVFSLAALAADDGGALYKKKCAGCHGAHGEGKPAVKAPALKGTQLEAGQIAEHTTKGNPQSKAPHNKPVAGVTEEQAKAIAEFVKSLK